jgi:hypothetical protein
MVAGRSYGWPMRKALATLLVLVSLGFLTILPGAGAGEATGIKGVVLNATCYGPCRYPPKPLPPYTGSDLTVTVRSLPDHRLIAKLYPTDGHFGIKVAPGPYRVRARVGSAGSCWRGEAKKVQVLSGALTRVRLHVTNTCIV